MLLVERPFAAARADGGVDIVQRVDAREIRLAGVEPVQQVARDRRGVELDAELRAVVADLRDFLGRKAVVEPDGRDAEHAERRGAELLEPEQFECFRADVGDDFHMMCARRAEQRADFFFECMRVALGDVQRREDARDAGGGSRFDEREIFFGRVVEAGITGNAILQKYHTLSEGEGWSSAVSTGSSKPMTSVATKPPM